MDISKQYNYHLWFSGILFTLHNIEESIGIVYYKFPEKIFFPIEPPQVLPMIWSVLFITVIAWGLLIWTIYQNRQNIKRNILTLMIFVFVINAFIPHIVGAVVFKRYFPAVITSVFLYIPYSLWAIPKLYKCFINLRQFIRTIGIGIGIVLLVTIFLQIITSRFLFTI